MVKDPATGKRISRPNPKTQYRIAEAPQLRIVDDVTFRAVQTLKAKRHHEAPPKARAAKRAFSGLIKCGSCGSGMASIGSDAKGLRVQCSAYRESGTCDNGRRVYLEEIETPVLKAIQQHLEDPELITEYINAYNAERERIRRDSGEEKTRLDRRNREIERELDRLIDSIAKGIPAETIAPRIQKLERERATVRAAIESAYETDGTIAIHPPSVDRYKRDLAELANMLKTGNQESNFGLYASLRELVTTIVVQAKPNISGVQIDIRGHLAALCDKVAGGSAVSGSIEVTEYLRQYPKAKSSGGLVVAREGLAPSCAKISTKTTILLALRPPVSCVGDTAAAPDKQHSAVELCLPPDQENSRRHGRRDNLLTSMELCCYPPSTSLPHDSIASAILSTTGGPQS